MLHEAPLAVRAVQVVGGLFGAPIGQINALAGGNGTTDPKKTGAGAGGNNLINQVPR